MVVGAGLAGLSAACHLAGAGHDVAVLEREQQPGGRAGTLALEDYRFDTEDGEKTLAELFDGRSQLLIYHFMFGPSYEAGDPVNSSIADAVDAVWRPWHQMGLPASSLGSVRVTPAGGLAGLTPAAATAVLGRLTQVADGLNQRAHG